MTLNVIELGQCPNCGGTRFKSLYPCEDRLHEMVKGLSYSRCAACGVRFLSTRVDDAWLIELYPSDYPQYQASASSIATSQRAPVDRQTRAAAVSRFERKIPDALRRTTDRVYRPRVPGPVLLDVGCGTAAFLAETRASGWRAIGVDFNADVVARIVDEGFEAVVLDDCDALGAGSVAQVRMSHVLEHVEDPPAFLTRFAQLLEPGGGLHVAIPNPVGMSARVFGQDWKSYDARHLILYSPSQARALVEASGFDVVSVHFETVTRDWSRSRGYRRLRRGRLTRSDVSAMHFEGWAAAGLWPLARAAAAVHLGDRVHLFAVRLAT